MKLSDKCEHCGIELIDKCYRCGAPVCCPRCCADTEPRRNGEKMKLSEVLKEDWPENYIKFSGMSISSRSFYDVHNAAITACDREIDKEALAKVMCEIDISCCPPVIAVEHIISTMPTWLRKVK